MTSDKPIKYWLKIKRWQFRRMNTAIKWGHSNLQQTPSVLGNAMPKSGSHLIIQILQGLTKIGPFVNPGLPPVNRSEDNQKLPDDQILINLHRMKPGDIAYGYIKALSPFTKLLTEKGRATIFVYRDPRDMIISHVFYATEMHPGHGMHQYYNNELTTMEERINAAIEGVQEPGSELSPIYEKYQSYLGWLDIPDVLSLRFEDIILDQHATIDNILDYLIIRGLDLSGKRQNAIDILQKSIAPKRSGTFRKGKPGNWREHFTDKNKILFKEQTDDLLLRLGYEYNSDW
jgi:sulfotransferase 6B1